MDNQQELNERVNALWAQLPVTNNLDEKFYAWVSHGKLNKFRNLVNEYPLMKEIAQIDQTIILGPVYNYHPDMIYYLVKELGLDPDFRRIEDVNRTILMVLLRHHHTEHRNVNLPNTEKFKRKIKTLEMLILAGADLDAIDLLGNTPLHYAISHIETRDIVATDRAPQAIEILLKSGADPNKQNFHGQTPLHKLLQKTQIPLVILLPTIELLIQYGAQENITDSAGNTPRTLVLSRSPLSAVADPIAKHLP